ncbi:hypothetical protein C5167_039683 [Papaver somniferum]|uniref:Uncharacterized protein n=1 Tax=Papaver somniferum TaxID=3469 RepID=A0A4Y7IFA3_PAPSO|nr:hypothetical protein C5167_039683 [Papaver somniferum]
MEYHWNPSLISSDQDEMFEEPDVENSIHFGAPAHAWRYYGATDWYQERTKISQSVVNCEFSVCCSRVWNTRSELSSIGSLVPPEDKEQGYNQLYMSDTELAHEALHRNNIFSNGYNKMVGTKRRKIKVGKAKSFVEILAEEEENHDKERPEMFIKGECEFGFSYYWHYKFSTENMCNNWGVCANGCGNGSWYTD